MSLNRFALHYVVWRESADTGPVVLKVVPVTGAAAFAGPHGPLNVHYSHTHVWYEIGTLNVSEADNTARTTTNFSGFEPHTTFDHKHAVI